jgi:hypothetical protein
MHGLGRKVVVPLVTFVVALAVCSGPALASPVRGLPAPVGGDLPPQSVHQYQCDRSDDPAASIQTLLLFSDVAPQFVHPGEPATLSELTVQIGADVTGTPGPSPDRITVGSLSYVIDTAGGAVPGQVTVTDPGGPVTDDGFTSTPATATFSAVEPGAQPLDYFPGAVTFTTTTISHGITTLAHTTCTPIQPVLVIDLSIIQDPAYDLAGAAGNYLRIYGPQQPQLPQALAAEARQLLDAWPPAIGVLKQLWDGDDLAAVAPLTQAILLLNLAVDSGGAALSPAEATLLNSLDDMAAQALHLATARAVCPSGPQCTPATAHALADLQADLAGAWSARSAGKILVATLVPAAIVIHAADIAPTARPVGSPSS